MDRRELLQWMVATGGMAAFTRLGARDLIALGEDTHRRLRSASHQVSVLSPRELATIEAAAETIVPRTTTPGASDAKVSVFIALMLTDWYPAGDVERFRTGISALNEASIERFKATFADAVPTQQSTLIGALDDEVAALRHTDSTRANAHWFAMLKYLTVWGYCTSEVAMRDVLHSYPRAMKYDGFAPVKS